MVKIFLLLIFIFSISGAKNIAIDTILDKAKKSHKQVVVFLHKPGCPYCEMMIDFTLSDEIIVEKIKKSFVFVDINIRDAGEVTFDDFKGSRREFAKFLGYDFYPSAVFIDNDKEIVYGEAGYKDEDSFLKILHYVESHSYEDMNIEDFK